uniref:Uncharacterized protein n=1 Tax=Ditylenchus dipsaci TaxID=166011 RepID=A0A915CRA3_9BILA
MEREHESGVEAATTLKLCLFLFKKASVNKKTKYINAETHQPHIAVVEYMLFLPGIFRKMVDATKWKTCYSTFLSTQLCIATAARPISTRDAVDFVRSDMAMDARVLGSNSSSMARSYQNYKRDSSYEEGG